MDNLSPEQIKSMISMLQLMLNAQSDEVDTDQDSKIQQKQSFNQNNSIKTNSKKLTKMNKNKFLDMPERNMHKEDIEVDKKLCVQPPVPRARQFSMIKVVCRVCGKKEEVSPNLIVDSPSRYKCNKCSAASG
jgi:hypothetical protein